MSKASRDKGKRGERMWAAVCREHGFTDARRAAQYSGLEGQAADVVGVPGVHMEVKFVEHLNLRDAMDQSLRDAASAGHNEISIVAHKKSNCGWLVTMTANDFFRLYQSYYTDMILEEIKEEHHGKRRHEAESVLRK